MKQQRFLAALTAGVLLAAGTAAFPAEAAVQTGSVKPAQEYEDMELYPGVFTASTN